MRHRPLEFLVDCSRRYGDLVRFRLGTRLCHLVTGAEAVRYVLQEGNAKFRKNPHYVGVMSEALGSGLITSEGRLHLRQRRLAQPAFHRDRIARFATAMGRSAVESCTEWAALAQDGEPLRLAEATSHLALTIVLRTLFGDEVDRESLAGVDGALAEMNRQLNEDLFSVVRVPRVLPTVRNRRFRTALATIDDLVRRMIERRRREPGPERDDLLSMLIGARDEDTAQAMSDEQVRDEVFTIFAAGHETAANALAWTCHLLSLHPDVAARLRAELIGELGGAPPELESLGRVPYLRMVVEEAMRIFPPVYLFDRVAAEDVAIDGVVLPRGSTVYLSPYATHRKPEYWEEPDRFAPEHFENGRVEARPRFAYFPFGAGPRQCIGSSFAMIETQIALAAIVQRFELLPASDVPPVPEPCITLRPPADLRVGLRPL